jgi:hypothetical protein
LPAVVFAASLLKKSAVANGPIPPNTPRNFLAFLGRVVRVDFPLVVRDPIEESEEESDEEVAPLSKLEMEDCDEDKIMLSS